MKIRKMVITALLTSIAIIIPVLFGGFLRIVIPPFTATLASHVPIFLSMFLGPAAASVVAVGSALGFLISFPDPVVAARALMHVGVVIVGSLMLKRNIGYWKVISATAFIHGLLECLIVIPFVGLNMYYSFVVVGIGTIIHHFADALITKGILPLVKIASPSFNNEIKKSA